jgi:hypothetical protein
MNKKNKIQDPVIIQAVPVRMSAKSMCFDCEGDLEWFPKTQFNFDPEKEELEIPKWLAREKFPNENF